MVANKKIVLGVTGGIAAYKACALTSKLTQEGAEVKVIMTESATKFVTPLTFQALSRNPVYTDTFDEKDPLKIAHIDLADWADYIVTAPATANIIGKLANGIADDMLTTTILATKASIFIAPAMNVNMYEHPAVMKHLNTLKKWGYQFIEPNAGYLACGWTGKGRLEEPEIIINVLKEQEAQTKLFSDKKILVSAGPTREKIDPVRYLTNRSTGKMGFSIAEAAANFGAEVTLVAGPVEETLEHRHVKRIDIITAEEMYETMNEQFPLHDIVIMSAAVADYRPKTIHKEKMKKQSGDMKLEMERTKDVLLSLGEKKKEQFLVGFAAETNEPLVNGRKKLKRKNLDAIIVNDVSKQGAGFAGDTNIVTYINRKEQEEMIPLAMKKDIAKEILKRIHRDLKDETN